MHDTAYIKRRDEIQHYFDRTALEAWKRLTSTEKVSGVRATVRAGREAMRAEILRRFPQDLSGWRILDAGCGAGPLAIELAHRGAHVLGVDLSPQMVSHANEALPEIRNGGSVRLIAGDMLAPEHGEFDGVVSMDALIHYDAKAAEAAIAGLARRTSRKMVFTLAPRTRPLVVMQAIGKLFPRGDRSPAIQPVAINRLIAETLARSDMDGWRSHAPARISRGFYISEAQELARS
ncbi:MAG: magnesium protoporphyrin IX methyltransferase [Hoeflea sp.]|uniref:magnesium protoporphyrin IX methyltransferase n=1 Tax=Hoeflea sp. TaxID=1940281 RepID=UPI001DA3E609|nr:magnesium protoporphyrin IX methyltransferase [Hoeflea sp.]MBU4527858.1 magnesium protoporphyrin IX methyltransferase [Alphaproteobacteria bacterium]MBU4546107.1 magnesium protoporphyrin IX methyltransferase [Alphaproteobacteria bacterium]MBU4553208.1 magnesium protoporphyrin IX methyltransferase [Alphaproteobacteria bacterium]MBV1724280.1 magnesium protoporphyrin IX methyltransferase [Hoeflea sp.]MBV1759965.1 magnesium protoporphyrin IX methyltransferase [Hoeflea sp.]